MQACRNETDYYSLFFNLFVDIIKTESFTYFFVLILYNIMTFFLGGGEGGEEGGSKSPYSPYFLHFR